MPKPTANLIKPINAMPEKSIAEMIHDRIVADGGTLNRWLNGAKFRRLPTSVKCRIVSTASDEEILDGLVEFKPSPELAALIRRNVDEVRSYFRRLVMEWRLQVEKENIPRVLSEGSSGPAQSRKGRDMCDCHGIDWSSISEIFGERAPTTMFSVVVTLFCLIFGAVCFRESVSVNFAEIQRVESGVLADRASVRAFGGKPSRFNGKPQGMGAGVLGAVAWW